MDNQLDTPLVVPSTAGRLRPRPRSAAAVLASHLQSGKKPTRAESSNIELHVTHGKSKVFRPKSAVQQVKSAAELPNVRRAVVTSKHTSKTRSAKSKSLKQLSALYGAALPMPAVPQATDAAVLKPKKKRVSKRRAKANPRPDEGDLDALSRQAEIESKQAKATIHGGATKPRPASAAPRLGAATLGALPARASSRQRKQPSKTTHTQKSSERTRRAWDSTTGLEADLSRSAPFRRLHHTRPGSGKPSTLKRAPRATAEEPPSQHYLPTSVDGGHAHFREGAMAPPRLASGSAPRHAHAPQDRSRSVMSALSPDGSINSSRLSPGGFYHAKRAAAQARDLRAHGIRQSHAASVQSLTDEVLAAEPALRRALVQLAKVSASCAAFGWSDTGLLLDAGTATGRRRGDSDTAGIQERGALEHTVDDFVALQQHVSNLQQNQYVRSLAQLRARLKQRVQELAEGAVADFQRRMAQELRRKPQLRTELTASGKLPADGAVSRLHLLARSVGEWDERLEGAYCQWVAEHRDEAVAAARTSRRLADAGAEEEAAAAGARVAHMASVRMGGFLRSAQLAAELDARPDAHSIRRKHKKEEPVDRDVWAPQAKSASNLPPPTPAAGFRRGATGRSPKRGATTPLRTERGGGEDGGLPQLRESASTQALRQHSVVLRDPGSVLRVLVGDDGSDSSLLNTDSDVDVQGALDAPLEGQALDSDSDGREHGRRHAQPTAVRQRRHAHRRGLHSNTAEALIRSVKVAEERSKIARRLDRERRRLPRVQQRVGGGGGGGGTTGGRGATPAAGASSEAEDLSSDGSSSDARSSGRDQQRGVQHGSWLRPQVDTAWPAASGERDQSAGTHLSRRDPIAALYGHSQLQRTASMRKRLGAASIEADLDATPEEAAAALQLAHGTVAQVILDSHFATISKAMKARRRWLSGKVQQQRQQHAHASSAMQRAQQLQAQRSALKREVGRTRLRLRHVFGHLLSPVGQEQSSVLWQRDIHSATKASALLAALAPPAVLAVLRMACHMLPAGLQWMVLAEHDMHARMPSPRPSAAPTASGLASSLPSVSLQSAAASRLSTQPLGKRFADEQAVKSTAKPAGRRVTLPGLAAAALITVHLRHSSHQLGGLTLLHTASRDDSRKTIAQRAEQKSHASRGGTAILDDTSREYLGVRRLIVRCAATSLLLQYKHALRHPDHIPPLPEKFDLARNTLLHYLPDLSHAAAQGVRADGQPRSSGVDIPHEDLLLALTVWGVANQASHHQHDTQLSRQYAQLRHQDAAADAAELPHPLRAWVLPPPARQQAKKHDVIEAAAGSSGMPAMSMSSLAVQSPEPSAALHRLSAPHRLSLRDVWDTEDAAALQQTKLQNSTGGQSALTRYRADRIGVSVERFLGRASSEAAATAGTLTRNGVAVSSVQQLEARPVSQAASQRHGAVAGTTAARAARRGMSVPTAAHALLRVFRGHVARQYVWALRYVTDPSAIALAFVSADDNGNGVVEPSELASLLVMLGGYSAASVRRARAHAQLQTRTRASADWVMEASTAGGGSGSSLLLDMARLSSDMGAQVGAGGGGITMEQFTAWWMRHVPHSSNIAEQLELVSAARSLYARNVGVLQRWRHMARACAQAREHAAMAGVGEAGGATR